MPVTLSTNTTVVVEQSSSTVFLPAGIPGPPGPGIELADVVDTYEDLPTDLGPEDAGAAYLVQSGAGAGKLYAWSGLGWPTVENGSDFRGEKGDPGVGIDSIATSGANLVFDMSEGPDKTVAIPALAAAAGSASAAAASATAAHNSETAAATSAGDASASKGQAADSASAAATSATTASAAASNADAAENAAELSAAEASDHADSADTSASAASMSASAAAGSAAESEASKTAAAQSATDAAESESAAATSATAAADSNTAAGVSATNAASSASTADGSADIATAGASAASDSAAAAATSAQQSQAARDLADGHAVAAADSATEAAGSAVTADGSASDAADSATAADGSATAASTSAAAAASSETNAATSASDAADSEASAEYWAGQAADTVSNGIPSATASVLGGIKLPGANPGELGGTAEVPTVVGWNEKADLVDGKVPTSQIPALAITSTFVVASETERLALTCETGDVAIQTDNPGRGTYILRGTDPTDVGDWVLQVSPTDSVSSVNGYQGIVVLGKGDVGLSNVNNTADSAKPVSTAQQAALDAKVPTSRQVTAGTGLTGGGDLTADRSLSVQYGTSAGTAAQGNDTRLANERTPVDGSVSTAKIADSAVATAKVANGAVTKVKTDTGVQASLDKADASIQKSGTATGLWMGTTLPGSGTTGVLYVELA